MSFTVPANLEAEIDELITHYPVKRSASLMLPGHMMSDTVAILGSFDFVMGECDR